MKREPQIPGRTGRNSLLASTSPKPIESLRGQREGPPACGARLAYSINEACALTGLGRDGLYGAIARGELVAKKFGARTVITSRDLERFLRSLPQAGKAA
jgi:excisionase family DNA binding protein